MHILGTYTFVALIFSLTPATTRGLWTFRDDDDEDGGGRNCGRKFDGDLGGRGGWGGDMPRFVS